MEMMDSEYAREIERIEEEGYQRGVKEYKAKLEVTLLQIGKVIAHCEGECDSRLIECYAGDCWPCSIRKMLGQPLEVPKKPKSDIEKQEGA